MQCAQPGPPPTTFPPVLDRRDLTCDVRSAVPAIAFEATRSNGDTQLWLPVPDLFGRTEPGPHFVADIDDVGRAVLRFGDGEYGQELIDVKKVEAWYRVGNGAAGNLGAEALAHIVQPDPLPASWPPKPAVDQEPFEVIRNPLPAVGGVDPELIEEVRQYAPAAFKATQLRAVTEQDYKDRALTIAGVAGAVAKFRWTGSWYTVFVGVDPSDPDQVITNARGLASLEPAFRQMVHDSLTRYRLAGYDLEIRAARYVPLDVAIQLCVKRGYFAGDVAHAASLVLGSGVDPRLGAGLFNPARLTFGQPVYLSRIYAAVEKVEGVESATVTKFQPYGRDAARELETGLIPIGPWEIARLDNDPSNMENGALVISAAGGS
jgi:predicted phage baseplate assembly protein